MDLEAHLRRQIAFSRATFGPGTRQKGVIDHIKKELKEIEDAPGPDSRAAEWIDVVILAFDGLWRCLHYDQSMSSHVHTLQWDELPKQITERLDRKMDRNEQRDWPDWRTADRDKAIEHVRGGEHD